MKCCWNGCPEKNKMCRTLKTLKICIELTSLFSILINVQCEDPLDTKSSSIAGFDMDDLSVLSFSSFAVILSFK